MFFVIFFQFYLIRQTIGHIVRQNHCFVCLGTFGDRLPPNSDKNHSPMTHRCKKYKKPYLRPCYHSIARNLIYNVCTCICVHTHAYAYTRVRAHYNIQARFRRASIRIGIMRSISNPCSMNNDRYRGSCRTVNKVSESIVVLNRNNCTKQAQVQCLC